MCKILHTDVRFLKLEASRRSRTPAGPQQVTYERAYFYTEMAVHKTSSFFVEQFLSYLRFHSSVSQFRGQSLALLIEHPKKSILR